MDLLIGNSEVTFQNNIRTSALEGTHYPLETAFETLNVLAGGCPLLAAASLLQEFTKPLERGLQAALLFEQER